MQGVGLRFLTWALLASAASAIVPAASPAAPPARLVGYYEVDATTVTEGGVPDPDFEPGGSPDVWRFAPVCKRGVCNVKWWEVGTAFRGHSAIELKVEKAALTRSRKAGKDVYTGSYREHCGQDEKPFRLIITVTASTLSKGKRVATRIRATLTHSVAYDNGPDGEVLYHDRIVSLSGRHKSLVGGGSDGQCVSRSI